MSRRDYPVADRYDDRESDFYRRPRRDRDYDELDVDITRSRYPETRAPRAETVIKERDTVINDRRSERGPRQPDFLRDDYGKSSNAGPLVLREDRREEDTYSRAPTRRRSLESVRSRAPPERVVEKEEIIIRERDRERDRGPPYPRSERDFTELDRKEDIVFRERARPRPQPPPERQEEEIDIKIRRGGEEPRPPPPRSEAPSRAELRERDVEEIRFRRGGGERPAPPRTEVDREEIRITERRSSPPARSERGRDVIREEIDIRERSIPAPRARSQSRGALVARKEEEWVVRRRRERSPTPPPPPRDYEKEEIIIRRKERTPSPEPVREPTPPPPPPPALDPIIRPPIIQEVITHHRHIDHGVERVRSPTPPPPPAPPSPPREENLEIEIRRQGMRNGKYYDEDIIFEKDTHERKPTRDVELSREVSRRRSISASTRRRSPSPARRGGRYDDDMANEAEYYNRKVSSRAYPGEAYNGATKDWGLVDVPPGTERVRMDGVGGGAQEITWQRYNGERRGRFITGDRAYEPEWGNGGGYAEAPAPPPIAPPARDEVRETRITERRIVEETNRGKTRDKMWTEITKDLVIKEAVDEMGYEYEETDDFFYVIEYLRYVRLSHSFPPTPEIMLTYHVGGRTPPGRADRRHPT